MTDIQARDPNACSHLAQRLNHTSDSQFRGAVWELFWFDTCRSLDRDVVIEFSELEGPGKTVDFFMPSLNVAMEVTTVNALDSTIAADSWVSQVHQSLQQLADTSDICLHAVFSFSPGDLPDVGTTSTAIWNSACALNSESELTSEQRGHFTLNEETLAVSCETWTHGGTGGWVFSSGMPNEEGSEDRIYQALVRKAQKEVAVPTTPLIVAVSPPGRLLGSDRFSFANVLLGQSHLHIGEEETAVHARDDSGFLAGAGVWRNSEVSAVAFTKDALPTFGLSSIEIWANGGARNALPLGHFEERCNLLKEVNGTVRERSAGTLSAWTDARSY